LDDVGQLMRQEPVPPGVIGGIAGIGAGSENDVVSKRVGTGLELLRRGRIGVQAHRAEVGGSAVRAEMRLHRRPGIGIERAARRTEGLADGAPALAGEQTGLG
jgi:hypothetical protein